MATQLAISDLHKEEMSHTNWLQQLRLFILFWVSEAGTFIFGSDYFEVFPMNKSPTFNLTLSTIFLAAALWFKHDKRWNKFPFLIASIARDQWSFTPHRTSFCR